MKVSAAVNQERRILSTSHGQSGDNVSLIFPQNRFERTIVEKSSTVNNSRLGRQALKQKTFPEIGNFSVPQVIRDWDGRSFCMEYVPGVALGTYLRTASHTQVGHILESLHTYFDHLILLAVLTSEPLGFDAEWQSKIRKMRDDHKTEFARQSLEWIATEANNIPYRRGINHGDFSFENILVSPQTGKTWIIDMLDSPIESPLLDVGRILIDLEHGWWKTISEENATEILARLHLAKSIRKLCAKNSISDLEIDFHKSFAALRILPYTKNAMRKAVLVSVIKSTTKYTGKK